MKALHICFTVILLVLCCPASMYAQQRIDVDIRQRPIEELIETVAKLSGSRIYYIPDEVGSMRVSVQAEQARPGEVLRMALRNTELMVSQFDNTFFILKGKMISTVFPYTFYSKEGWDSNTTDYTSSFRLEQQQEQVADSEYKLYEVGNPTIRPDGPVTLSGRVLDSKSGEPRAGIYVYILDTSIADVTNAQGEYSIELAPGRYVINVRGLDVTDAKRQLQIYSDGRLDITAFEHEYTFEEITVRGDRRDNIRQTILGAEHMRMKDIKNIPTAFGEADIMRIVLSLPGVKAVGEISSGFNVRGGATDQNLILFNEGTIYNSSHLFGMFSAINPDVVQDMELFKSSIPAKYGGRISSVLDINGREGNMKEYKGSASIGLLTSRLALEGPIARDKASLLVGARTTYSDWMLGWLPSNSGYRDGRAGFSDFNATLTIQPNRNNKISVNGYYSRDRFRFEKTENYKYHNANASVKWRHFFSAKVMSSLTAGYDHYDYNIANTEDSLTAYRLKFDINQLYGKLDLQWKPEEKATFNFGLNSLHYTLSPGSYDPYDGKSWVEADKIQKEKALESAVYVSGQWDITPKLAVDLGVRYSLYNVLGPRTYNTYDPQYLPSEATMTGTKSEGSGILKTYHGPEFRGAVRYAIRDDLSVKAGVNSMRQYIHKVSNTSIMSPTDTWKLSDMNIRPQSGIQYAAGVYKNFKDKKGNLIEVSLEGYYKTMDHYLDYRPGAKIVMNHHIETDVIETKGRAYGVELMVRKREGKLNGWVSYTYARTQLRQEDGRITKPVNDGEWYSADFDKPHEFKLIGNYKFTQRYSLSVNCEYSTGRPMTIPVSKYIYVNDQFVYYSKRNQYRIPDYFRMDISFNIEPSHHLTLLTHSMISIGVYNITARRNAYSVYYKSDKGFINGYRLSIFGTAIPYVSYNIKF